MDIPDWVLWTNGGLAGLQVLGLVPVVRRMRGDDPAERSKARLDLLESIAGLMIFGGVLLVFLEGESGFWLPLVGFALASALYAWKGILLLRARRRPAA
ncbi:hypothetical protein ACF09L_00280 [Streptomyces sp. NPDC014779]|uniref:hypothetical protein n=1 Tax=Streptomyces sp. NPDC014779 TaxID=3364911 RepID=UPI0036F9E463